MQASTHSDTLSGAWNWKAATTSAFVRGGTFLAANLHDGPINALRAMLVAIVFAIFAKKQ